MFEHIVLRKSESGNPITAGQLAEAMLYYQKVHLIIDQGTLRNLFQQLGSENLISTLQRSDVSAVYCEEILATHTESVGVMKFHHFSAIQMYAEPDGRRLSSEERLWTDLVRSGVEKTVAKKFAIKFLRLVPTRKFSGDRFVKGGIPKLASEDLRDESYVEKAIQLILHKVEGAPKNIDQLRFEIVNLEQGDIVFTNIDFDEINRRRSRCIPSLDNLSVAHLLTELLIARADIVLASHYGGDFITSSAVSSIIQFKHAEILRRSGLNLESKQNFEEVVLPEMPRLSDVIDSGGRTFTEFLVLLDRAMKFKEWLKSTNPDENLVSAYLQEVSRNGWLEQLPAKGLRYLMTTGIGLLSTPVGIIASAADSFIVEKLLSGWRPNHFVSSKLIPFLNR